MHGFPVSESAEAVTATTLHGERPPRMNGQTHVGTMASMLPRPLMRTRLWFAAIGMPLMATANTKANALSSEKIQISALIMDRI